MTVGRPARIITERGSGDWSVPRHPLPTVVAHVISDALDREVSVEQLWSGRARRAELWIPADVGLRLPWSAEGTVRVLDDWLRHTGGDACIFGSLTFLVTT